MKDSQADIRFFYLTEGEGKGLVIKENSDAFKEWLYDSSLKSWVPIGVMWRYRWYKEPEFGKFYELSEQEAMDLIGGLSEQY